jgi:hypothetical protein
MSQRILKLTKSKIRLWFLHTYLVSNQNHFLFCCTSPGSLGSFSLLFFELCLVYHLLIFTSQLPFPSFPLLFLLFLLAPLSPPHHYSTPLSFPWIPQLFSHWLSHLLFLLLSVSHTGPKKIFTKYKGFHFCFGFLFSGDTGIWTQGLALGRQASSMPPAL